MKITIVALGTRGDVQPMIALGKALQVCGHTVRMIASARFKGWIEQHGLEARAAELDIQAILMSEHGHAWVEQGTNPIKQMRVMKQLFDQYGPSLIHDAWRACEGAEAIISGFVLDTCLVSIAEKLRARHISAVLQPAFFATRSGGSITNAPLPNQESVVNYLFGKWLIEPSSWWLTGGFMNRFRSQVLDLPPQTLQDNRRGMRDTLVVQGFSPHIVPHPRDWPANIHTAGYWFLDEREWEPPQKLLDFLHAGDPPVYIGFGSMTGRNPETLTRTLVAAVTQSRQRAILQSGWSNLGQTDLPSGIFLLDSAPHGWLFPRMSAVVHHGGAGTTAAGLRAGVPSIVVPHLADQPFWGARMAALGVGPKPIPRSKLTAENLAGAIRQATGDAGMRRRAATLSAKIHAEDGIGAAVALIDRHLRGEARRNAFSRP